MNINLTLIGQSITFALFVWFCYAYVWPPLINALTERKKQIADGLAAAERGQHEHELAEKYRQRAEDVENAGYQRFAVALRSLAESYDRDAERIIAKHT